jgi:hypothetical protein
MEGMGFDTESPTKEGRTPTAKNIGYFGGVSLLVNSMTGPAIVAIPAVVQVRIVRKEGRIDH